MKPYPISINNQCDIYQLYNDLQFPFDKVFVDIRRPQKYNQKHIRSAQNIWIDMFQSYVINKQFETRLMQILHVQTLMKSNIWLYGDLESIDVDSKAFTQFTNAIAKIVTQALPSQPFITINIFNSYNAFESKFPFLCDNTLYDSVVSQSNKKTETEELLDQYLGIMLNQNKDNILLYPSCIIDDALYLGNAQHALSNDILSHLGITHVINCTLDVASPFKDDPQESKDIDADNDMQLNLQYLQIPVSDIKHEQIDTYFMQSIDFIEQALEQEDSRILCHCMAGMSRSSTIVIAYLMYKQHLSMNIALQMVKARRHIVCPNDGFKQKLLLFDKYLKQCQYDTSLINAASYAKYMKSNCKKSIGNICFEMMYYELYNYIEAHFVEPEDESNIKDMMDFAEKYHLTIRQQYIDFWAKFIDEIYIAEKLDHNIELFNRLMVMLFENRFIENDVTKCFMFISQNLNDSMLKGMEYGQHLGQLFGLLIDKKIFESNVLYIFCELCWFGIDKDDDLNVYATKENCGKIVRSTIDTLKRKKNDDMVQAIVRNADFSSLITRDLNDILTE